MVATGLSETPQAYQAKLEAVDDAQIDAWVTGSLRDIAKRRGVGVALRELAHAAGLDEDALASAYTLGGGPAATMGRDAAGNLLFPAVGLWAFVPGIRAHDPARGRSRLIAFLVATFEEVVYI
ncbi:MAG: hypothetical protein RLZZ432_713 [Chloroflexota bacterium]|jgi:hypothetical protein